MCVCICAYACVCAYMCVCVYGCACMCVYVWMYVCVHVRMHTCECNNIWVHPHLFWTRRCQRQLLNSVCNTWAQMTTHTHTHTHTRTRTHPPTHTHVHVQPRQLLNSVCNLSSSSWSEAKWYHSYLRSILFSISVPLRSLHLFIYLPHKRYNTAYRKHFWPPHGVSGALNN